MIRSDILKELVPVLSDQLVVTNIGLPSQEMHMLDDQPTNFYMLGTMGLASSIGLGLALAQDKKVIAIDGDGSVLMNLGTLPTIGNNECDNYILLIIDNGSYGSTGDQKTYSGMKTFWQRSHVPVDVRMLSNVALKRQLRLSLMQSQAIRAQLSSQNANQETFRYLLSTKTL